MNFVAVKCMLLPSGQMYSLHCYVMMQLRYPLIVWFERHCQRISRMLSVYSHLGTILISD